MTGAESGCALVTAMGAAGAATATAWAVVTGIASVAVPGIPPPALAVAAVAAGPLPPPSGADARPCAGGENECGGGDECGCCGKRGCARRHAGRPGPEGVKTPRLVRSSRVAVNLNTSGNECVGCLRQSCCGQSMLTRRVLSSFGKMYALGCRSVGELHPLLSVTVN